MVQLSSVRAATTLQVHSFLSAATTLQFLAFVFKTAEEGRTRIFEADASHIEAAEPSRKNDKAADGSERESQVPS